MIYTVRTYMTDQCQLDPESIALRRFLYEVEIDPDRLATPWDEFACDCARWVRTANHELEKEFTPYDVNKYGEPTNFGHNVREFAEKLSNAKFREVVKVYELRNNAQSLTYGDTKYFRNWPATADPQLRLRRIIENFLPKGTPQVQVATGAGLSKSTIQRAYNWAYKETNAKEPSSETFEKLANFFGMPVKFLKHGQLPDPEQKPLAVALVNYLMNIRQEVFARRTGSVFTGQQTVRMAIGMYSDNLSAEIDLLTRIYMFAPRHEGLTEQEIRKAAGAYRTAKMNGDIT